MKPLVSKPEAAQPGDLLASISAYLRTVHIVADARHLAKLQARLLVVLESGVQNDDGTRLVIGLGDADWLPAHEAKLVAWVRGWLKRERVVFSGCEDEVAAEIVRRARIALEIAPVRVVPRENGRQPDRTISMPQRQPADDMQAVQLALF